ncbi:DMT family transporter [soil metagenome]
MRFAPSATLNLVHNPPALTWFAVSAVFHYLGPSFAVLLFPAVGVLGVAWLRIGSAALFFLPWTRLLLVALGVCLAMMNTSFYLALERLPIGLVAAIEFVGTIGVALYGVRTLRNGLALMMAVVGVLLLIDPAWSSDAIGPAWAASNGALFSCYILIGHRISEAGAAKGIERLGAAMAVAFLCVLPIGFSSVVMTLDRPQLLAAGLGVGACSSVIPYVCDQLAMARLSRSAFALLLALLPAVATLTGALVLAQIPGPVDILGVALVMIGVAIRQQR